MFNALNIWKSRFRHVGGQLLIECIQFCLAVGQPSRGAWQASSSPSEKSSVIIQLNSGPFHILGKRAMGIEMQSGSADGDLRIRAQARYNRLRFLTHFAGVWINAMVKVNPYDAIVVEDEPHTIIWLLPSLSLRLLIKRLRLVVGCPGPRIVRFRDRKSTRLNSSHANISYAVFCLKKKKIRISIARDRFCCRPHAV